MDAGHTKEPQGAGKSRLRMGRVIGKKVAFRHVSGVHHMDPGIVEGIA
jgi:hypothetical protein